MTISPGDWIGPDGKPRDGAPLGMLLSAQAASQPDALALAINGQCYSFAQMDAAANRLARHLATRSVVAGSHVVLSMPNRVEMVQAVFALWKLGAVPCPVSWRLSEREFCAIVGLIAPCCVIGTAATPVVAENFIDIDAGLPEGLSPAPLPPAISDPGKVLTSGGSTGQPKLIVDPIPAVWGRDKAVPYRPAGTTVLNAGPMYHTAPFNFCAVAMAEGSHIVSMTSFEPREWLDLVERFRPDVVCLVPTMMSRIAKLPAARTAAADLSSIATLVHVAAHCPPDIKLWWIARIGAEKIIEVYGGSERIGATIINGTEWLSHPGSVGRAVPGDEIFILDDNAQPLPTGEVGEIHFRRAAGPGTHYRYIGSATRIRDGLDSFGDMGWLDADGYLYIADRRTDMVVVGGVNVYPAEIEAVIETLPGVACAAVIGLPDEDIGNRLHAIIELAEETPEPANAMDFLAPALANLAGFKRPRSAEFMRERLRDDAGKLRRLALRAQRLPG